MQYNFHNNNYNHNHDHINTNTNNNNNPNNKKPKEVITEELLKVFLLNLLDSLLETPSSNFTRKESLINSVILFSLSILLIHFRYPKEKT